MTTPATPLEPFTPAVAPRRGGGWINVLLGLALVVAVGGVAFAVGRSTAPARVGDGQAFPLPGASLAPGASIPPGGAPIGGGPGGFLATGPTVHGTVETIDDDSMRLKLDSGETVEISLDGETSYHRQAEATSSDVTAGTDVLVQLDGLTGRPAPDASPSVSLGNASDVTVIP